MHQRHANAIAHVVSEALATFDQSIGTDLDNYAELFDQFANTTERIDFDPKLFNILTRGGMTRKSLNIFMAEAGWASRPRCARWPVIHMHQMTLGVGGSCLSRPT